MARKNVRNDDKKKPKATRKKPQVVGFLGVGLDNQDGEQRLTHSEHFFLVGGSQETHEHMQETAIKVEEGLKRRGKPLQEASSQEVIELFFEARE